MLMILFISCEKELYVNEIKKNEITVKNFSLKDLEPLLVSKINRKIEKIKNVDSEQNKNEYIEGLDVYIDTENGQMIIENGKTSYTFPIYDLNSPDEKIRNLVFKPEINGDLITYLVKYNFTKEELDTMSSQQILQDSTEFFSIDFDDERITMDIFCVDTQQLQVVPINQGDLTGEFGTQLIWITISSQCSWMSTDTGGGYNYSGNTYTQGSSTLGGGGTNSNTVATTPLGLSEEQQIIKNFQMNVLNTEQLSWYNSHPETHEYINTLIVNNSLDPNNPNMNNQEFALEMINASIMLDINAALVWDDYNNFVNQMSISEKNIFNNLLPNRKLWYMCSAKKAFDKANELFPTSTHNGKGDAFRHALWNGYCALTLAGNLGEQLTTAHENKPSEYPFNYKETEMDLYNNNQGRLIAISSNLNNIVNNILLNLQAGFLRYLNNLDPNDNDNATYYSVLIPTDQ
jgi:hypothetical protein